MKKTNKKAKGFTLVELVVVVAIIGVLATIITPRFKISLMKSKDAKVLATLHTLKTASNVYYAEKGTLPSGAVPTVGQVITAADLVRLQKANYLSEQDVNKLTLGKTDSTPVLMAAGVVQDANVTKNCTLNVDGTYSVAVDPDFTPGFVKFIWDNDGIGLNIVGLGPNGQILTTAADTGCRLWADRVTTNNNNGNNGNDNNNSNNNNDNNNNDNNDNKDNKDNNDNKDN